MDNSNLPISDGNNNAPQGGPGLGIASMVLGILSVLLSCCFYYASFPLGIIGLILGGVSIAKKHSGKGMAITGLVLSIISIALGIIAIIIGGAFLAELGLMS